MEPYVVPLAQLKNSLTMQQELVMIVIRPAKIVQEIYPTNVLNVSREDFSILTLMNVF